RWRRLVWQRAECRCTPTLRVGFYEDNGLFRPSPAIRRAVREAAEILAAKGATVKEVKAPDGVRTLRDFIQLIAADRLEARFYDRAPLDMMDRDFPGEAQIVPRRSPLSALQSVL